MKRLISGLALVLSITIVFSLFYQFFWSRSTHILDYMTFYLAGKIVAQGRAADLYPPPGTTSFRNAPYMQTGRELVPEVPATFTTSFMYMPVVAWLFVPYSFLPAKASLIAWQATLLMALACCAFAVAAGVAKASGRAVANYVLYLLPFVPVVVTLWVGQVGIALAVLPFCLGFYFLVNRQYVKSGLLWSLAVMKPQLLIPAIAISVVLAVNRKFGCLTGIVCGGLAIALLNCVVCGPDLFFNWISSLKLSEAIFSDPTWAPAHLVTNLPRQLIFLAGDSLGPFVKPVVYGLSLVLFLWGLYRACKFYLAAEDEVVKLSMAALIGLCMTPLVVPHLFMYDLSILIPAGLIIASVRWPAILSDRLRSLLLISWVCINLYGLLALYLRQYANPLVMALLLFEFYRRLLSAAAEASRSTDGQKTTEVR